MSLRGYTYRNLSARFPRWSAALWTTAFFLAVPAVASVVHAAVAGMIGATAPSPRVAPGGEEPIAYLILLAVFGMALVTVRIATASLWTTIGFHLTFLTVNRMVVTNDPDRTGWSVALTTPDALLLIPGYVILAAALTLAAVRWQGHRLRWREHDPDRG